MPQLAQRDRLESGGGTLRGELTRVVAHWQPCPIDPRQQQVVVSQRLAQGQALAQVNRAHRLEHREFPWRQGQIAGVAVSLGSHDGVASVHIDAGLTYPQGAEL